MELKMYNLLIINWCNLFISENHLVIENGNFSWGSDDQVILRNINLSFKQGSLVAVVGTVGSGKSSLISAFLGEMDKITGRVNTKVRYENSV